MNEYSAPIDGHRPKYWAYYVYCDCGWQYPASMDWLQRRAYRKHMDQVSIETEKK